MNRSEVTSPNPTPVPLRSINPRPFHFFLCALENLQREYRGSLNSVNFSLFHRPKEKKTKQKETIRLSWGHPLFVRLASNMFPGFGSVSGVKKKITRNLRIGGLKHQHHCRAAWKQQGLVTKSTPTQYGGKYDGQFYLKKGPKRVKSKKDTPRNVLCLEMLL